MRKILILIVGSICLTATAQISKDTTIEAPYALLGGLSVNTAQTASMLAAQDSMVVISSYPYRVTQFKLILTRKNGPAQLWTSKSAQLSTACKDALAKAQTGDRVLIEAIKSELVIDGETFRAYLTPIVYEVR
jgi:hypothetical protein